MDTIYISSLFLLSIAYGLQALQRYQEVTNKYIQEKQAVSLNLYSISTFFKLCIYICQMELYFIS